MGAEQWLVACMWVAGTMVLVALILIAIALADPERRHRTEEPSGEAGG